MTDFTRRDLLEGIVATGAGLLISAETLLEPTALAATERKGAVFSASHAPKPLPYSFGKLKGLSEKLIKSHWENNYCGAVKALNAVESKLSALLADKEFPAFLYADCKREQLVRTGSVVLHEVYFKNLGGEGKPTGEIAAAINQAFGSLDTWESEFRKIATGLSGGSGWVVLSYNLHLDQVANQWAWDHMHNAPSGIPLLALDMYEHAYHLDYGAAAAKYIDAFFLNINWEDVNSRLLAARKAALLIKA